ncbi:MAG: sigma-70 family RNA polymerase sigma factor [Oscillospiraceae bacterium]|nr:sigma-70 family RNA polymerase sigma factor [Oscillospiraceae bacterium]
MFWLIVKLALENFLFFGLHFEGKRNFPKQLSSKEETHCLEIMSSSESTEIEIKAARDKLIVHNLRLVAYIVNKKYPDFADADDLVSIGTIGLIRAAETFDPNKNNKFSTYASRCIDNQIKMHFRKIKHQREEIFISEPIDCDAEGNSLTIEDIYSSDINIEQTAELKINSEKLYRFISEELDEREREIICKRYGVADKNGKVTRPMTQREIAKQMGISRSYISRIEKKALEKLRARFDER